MPPVQRGDPDYWQVEPDISLYHFAQGEGRNVLIVHGGPGMPYRQPMAGLESLTGEYRFHYYDQRGCGKSTRPIDGLLFDPDDQAAFIAAVQRLLADREWARQMGHNGRSHVESLSWAHVFEKLVADYQTLLQG